MKTIKDNDDLQTITMVGIWVFFVVLAVGVLR
jgi:hypothetical protein